MTQRTGYRVYGGPAVLHTGAGRLMGYLISHGESSAQTVTFYDSAAASGTILHRVTVDPGRCPIYVSFGLSKNEAVPFTAGLAVDPGNCDVAVWSVSY